MNNEIEMKPLLGAGDYMADINGNIYNKRGKRLKPLSNGWAGYCQLSIKHDDGTTRNRTIHRLVWEAFNGAIPTGLEINHLDENKQNNALNNLEMVTHRENCQHGNRGKKISNSMRNGGGLKAQYAAQVAARRAGKEGK